jgi:hypothetical protein
VDLNQAGTGNLTGHFQDGHQGTPYRVASSNGTAMSNDPSMPGGFSIQSVLQSNQPSSNGMSGQDYSRMLPGGQMLPDQNGSDPKSYTAAKYMRYLGDLAV